MSVRFRTTHAVELTSSLKPKSVMISAPITPSPGTGTKQARFASNLRLSVEAIVHMQA